MPVFIAALLGGLVEVAGSMAGRVLLSLGFGFVAYSGVDVLLSGLKDSFVSASNGLGSQVIGMLGVLRVGTCFNILMSAWLVRMTLAGLSSGVVKRLVAK